MYVSPFIIMEYIELELDSNLATASNTTGFQSTDWPLFQLGNRVQDIKAFKVLEVSLPQVWANYYRDDAFSFVTGLFSIPVPINTGQYTKAQFIAELNTVLNNPVGQFVVVLNSNLATHYGGTGPIIFSATEQTTGTNIGALQIVALGNTPELGSLNLLSDAHFSMGGITTESVNRYFLGFPDRFTLTSNSGASIQATMKFPQILKDSWPGYVTLNSQKLGVLVKAYEADTRYISLPFLQGNGQGSSFLASIPIKLDASQLYTQWQDPAPDKFFDLKNLFTLESLDLYWKRGGMKDEIMTFRGCNFFVKIALLIASDNGSTTGGPPTSSFTFPNNTYIPKPEPLRLA